MHLIMLSLLFIASGVFVIAGYQAKAAGSKKHADFFFLWSILIMVFGGGYWLLSLTFDLART
jgi:hypothetical protein